MRMRCATRQTRTTAQRRHANNRASAHTPSLSRAGGGAYWIPTEACSSGRRLPWARWVRTPGAGQTRARTGTLTHSATTAPAPLRACAAGKAREGWRGCAAAGTRARRGTLQQGPHRGGAGEGQGENSATHPGRQRVAAQSVAAHAEVAASRESCAVVLLRLPRLPAPRPDGAAGAITRGQRGVHRSQCSPPPCAGKGRRRACTFAEQNQAVNAAEDSGNLKGRIMEDGVTSSSALKEKKIELPVQVLPVLHSSACIRGREAAGSGAGEAEGYVWRGVWWVGMCVALGGAGGRGVSRAQRLRRAW